MSAETDISRLDFFKLAGAGTILAIAENSASKLSEMAHTVRNLKTAYHKIPSNIDATIVHISDLHIDGKPDSKFYINAEHIKHVCETIKEITRDTKNKILILTGDYVSSNTTDLDEFEKGLQHLGDLPDFLAKVAVLGNHDLKNPYTEKIKTRIQKVGIDLPQGQKQTIKINGKKILFHTLSPSLIPYEQDIEKQTRPLIAKTLMAEVLQTKADAHLVLSHNPSWITDIPADTLAQIKNTLFCSGHSHGGQLKNYFGIHTLVRRYIHYDQNLPLKGLHRLNKRNCFLNINTGIGVSHNFPLRDKTIPPRIDILTLVSQT